ncbi:hypothetical protein [Actinomadura rugatobispora]|uniref:Uncharacterized protein n=1 Tax=Actinomadura rugatobispora TaxID=1994 RepID=A0ABW1AGA1_9ACTN|nr:hypothetical protein GCM10010200_031640 [Actinomadura rugatobispora]
MSGRTPQEKKRLSYLKDRRNLYGENHKSSRKNIPRNRRIRHRTERHRVRQTLGQARGVPDERHDDAVEQRLKEKRPANAQWRKAPDTPLNEVIEYRLLRRVKDGNAAPDQAESRIRRIRRRIT